MLHLTEKVWKLNLQKIKKGVVLNCHWKLDTIGYFTASKEILPDLFYHYFLKVFWLIKNKLPKLRQI